MPYSANRTLIVQTLVDYFTENPEFKTAFEQSFRIAYATGIKEFKTFNIQSVDDYLRYMDDFVNWTPTEDSSGTNVYNHICMFYFILDLPPVREYQSPVDPSVHYPWRWLSDWLVEYAREMGRWMDSDASINEDAIKSFEDSPACRDTAETKFYDQYSRPPNGWVTFNEFFARSINPSFRPVADPSNASVIVSPADCTFDGVWAVTENPAEATTFEAKGVPWNIGQLIGDGQYGPEFAGGVFTHSFLKMTDYHRVHSPVAGVVVQAQVIEGLCHLEVDLDTEVGTPGGAPRLRMRRPMLTEVKGPANTSPQTVRNWDGELVPGYQFVQARAAIIIDSAIGLVAVLSIGMAQISSVVMTVQEGDNIEKGQEISYFQFGGSDVVMIFQKEANVKLDQEKGMRYKVGSRIGRGEVRR
ncbi:phosphatidylserine decarboxylase-domain-containing protein [Cubamyces menziesii]|uniref:Phosphatidylserine decarboxylase n=1 Tax=Trametes cubensis TaxID=1111947 RepID=A0AAD7X8S9_9APHY|nr:phosphatidylserine decarboxylase-domain-containing protein [Cubamyces menziesii]KAJ8481381.1 hypothetical protein ONZ51_g6043 [Trametes cubensis]